MLFFKSNTLLYSRIYNAIKFKLKGLLVLALLCGAQTSFAFFSHTTSENDTTQPKAGFLSSIEQKLVNFVRKTVTTVRYNSYKLGGSHFDTLHGIYAVDCSTYIDNILENVHPEAYSTLINSTGSDKPTTKEYYTFFSHLRDDSDYWNKVDNVKELRPGDILVFRNKGRRTGGHVMVVMNAPTKEATGYAVRVADSAPSGHSEDTRPFHNSGIGIGTLQLKVNPKTGEPSAYAWKVGSCWKKNVKFAMARPYDSEIG
jgi:hypothetical protein